MMTNRGDDEGVVFRDSLGKPLAAHRGRVHHVLLINGQRWVSDGDHGTAQVTKADREHALSSDIRAVGLAPNHRARQDLHSTLWRSGMDRYGEVLYKTAQENGLHVVRARMQAGDDIRQAVWWIDPAKGWCPVKTQWLLNGVVYRESRTTPAKFGDVWFPESVAFFAWKHKDGREPYRIITVHTATFDQSLPDRLTPEDIGVQVGTTVGSALQPFTKHAFGWDGSKLVPYRDLVDRIRSGELEYGAGFLRHSRALVMENEAKRRAAETGEPEDRGGTTDRFGLSLVDQTPGLWEQYVERFIAEYKLNRDQAQKARTVLRYCQEQGHHYLNRHAANFKELESLEHKVKGATTDSEAKTAQLADVYRRRARLQRPLVRIFEDQLVPRLQRLPTRAQRKAAAAVEHKNGRNP